MSAPQSQWSLDSRGEAGLGQVNLGGAQVSHRVLGPPWILDPQESYALAPCSTSWPHWPSRTPWPQTNHAPLSPPPFEPFSSAVPFPELLSPPQMGWGLCLLLTPQMVLSSTRAPDLPASFPLLTPPPHSSLSRWMEGPAVQVEG